jgi:hypothetical protein
VYILDKGEANSSIEFQKPTVLTTIPGKQQLLQYDNSNNNEMRIEKKGLEVGEEDKRMGKSDNKTTDRMLSEGKISNNDVNEHLTVKRPFNCVASCTPSLTSSCTGGTHLSASSFDHPQSPIEKSTYVMNPGNSYISFPTPNVLLMPNSFHTIRADQNMGLVKKEFFFFL